MYTADIRITAQYYENYSDNDTPYWKPKGGCDYVVKNFEGDMDDVLSISRRVECDNEFYREYLIDWKMVENDYLTEFEKCQLEYDGQILYPAKELVL